MSIKVTFEGEFDGVAFSVSVGRADFDELSWALHGAFSALSEATTPRLTSEALARFVSHFGECNEYNDAHSDQIPYPDYLADLDALFSAASRIADGWEEFDKRLDEMVKNRRQG